MKKQLKIVVLAKQVPDTRNVGKDAMTPEGTVNRAALPAIFNPEDLNALEMALALKDRTDASTVHILTMGPQRAADIIRDAMFRGADGGYLLSGREFAGSDTLATSYALSCALKKIRPDIIFAGRQAIDGDTAQVGPQVAEKLGLPQVTYAEEILDIKDSTLVIRRRLNCGTETVECPVPAVITVNASAPECRPRNAKRVMTCKFALSGSEIAAAPESEAGAPPRSPTCRSSSGLPPTSIPTRSSSAFRVRPRRSRRSRTWFSRPRRPRSSPLPTRISIH